MWSLELIKKPLRDTIIFNSHIYLFDIFSIFSSGDQSEKGFSGWKENLEGWEVTALRVWDPLQELGRAGKGASAESLGFSKFFLKICGHIV